MFYHFDCRVTHNAQRMQMRIKQKKRTEVIYSNHNSQENTYYVTVKMLIIIYI